MIVGLAAILLAPALLYATTLLEHLIASPDPDRALGPQRSNIPTYRKDGEADEPPRVLARGVPGRPRGGVGLEGRTRSALRTA